MMYYQVKESHDNTRKYNQVTKKCNGIWIGNELYTHAEIERMKRKGIYIDYDKFHIVHISKNDVYWFFGARFADVE